MDLGAVETIFSFGKLLGLTPSTTKNLTVSTPRKIYIISIFLFCSVCSTILLVQQVSRYSNLTLIHSALEILLQVVLFAHSFYILIVSGLLKQRQWSQLLRNLQRVECEPSNKKSLHLIFFLPNAAYAVTIVFVFYAWIKIVGGAKLFKMHTLESLQAYSQSFYNVLACVVLQMILSRYKNQYFLLNQHFAPTRKQLSKVVLLKVKRNLLVLRETVDLFNDIFGWTILLSIFFGGLRGLTYLDKAIKENDHRGPQHQMQMAAHVVFLLVFWVSLAGLATLVSLCFPDWNLRLDNVVRRDKTRIRGIAFLHLPDADLLC
jgi:hypothetical protein